MVSRASGTWRTSFWLALLLVFGLVTPGLPQDPGDVCDIETAERVVAIADVHGAYDRFIAILRAAGLIDGRERWAGGRTILVQTGDVLDRGPDSRKALDLLRRLSDDAPKAGGRVHALLGNHEVMRMVGDLRYVNPGEYAAFRSGDSDSIRDRYYGLATQEAAGAASASGKKFDERAFRDDFIARTPLGSVEMQLAFGPKGEYGRWLRQRNTMIRINGVVFIHGGTSPAVAAMGCAKVNQDVRSDLDALGSAIDPQRAATLLATSEDGPLWYRGLAQNDEASFTPELEAILRQLNARAIVTGHTVAANGRVRLRFGGRVIQLDTGMLGGRFFPAGRASALEILDGRITAIYEDRRDPLPSALGAAAIERRAVGLYFASAFFAVPSVARAAESMPERP
jgi:Calcineurin-like phosphoesterase